MSDHEPSPKNCTLPPPVRGSHPGALFANCEACDREYILITDLNDDGTVNGHWEDRVGYEKWFAGTIKGVPREFQV